MISRALRIFASTNEKSSPNLGNDVSSVWNFCAPSLDVISYSPRSVTVLSLRTRPEPPRYAGYSSYGKQVPWLKVGCFLRLERFSYDLEKWFRQVFVICFIQPMDEKIIDKPIKSLYCRSFVVSVLFASFHLKVIRKSLYLAFCCLPFSLVESSTAKPTVTMLSFVWGRNAQSWCHLIPEEPSSPGNFM